MQYLLKPHRDTTSMYAATISCADWQHLLQHPAIIADKNNAPLAIYGTMAANIKYDGKHNAHCIADNIDSIYALQIDYDDGYTIANFCRDYADYQWSLYTSYSYGYKDNDRFRVVLPLVESVRVNTFSPLLKSELCSQFPGADKSCFDRGHWQILPCVRSADAPYKYVQNKGKRYDRLTQEFADKCLAQWRADIAARKVEADAKRVQRNDANADARRKAGALRKAQEIIDSAVQGERNRTLWSVLTWLKNTCEMEADECDGLDVPYDMEHEYRSMLSRIW